LKVAPCVEAFIERKRLCGYEYVSNAKILRRFAKFIGNQNISRLSEGDVNAFLNRGRLSNVIWRSQRSLLRRFFAYWFARRLVTQIPEPEQKPAVSQAFFPHIYSRDEIVRLLEAAPMCQIRRRCTIDAETMRTIILFIYGTGAKIRDVLALTRSNVNLQDRLIELYPGSIYRHRIIPIGTDIQRLLNTHLRRAGGAHDDPGKALFSTKKGQPVPYGILLQTFARLRIVANVSRANSSFRPRIQDLRHTFAVHSITKWDKKGWSFERMLPILAMYMGNVNELASEKYLELTPSSFRPQLDRLNIRCKPNRRKTGSHTRLRDILP
jgi:integrase/recombinase XerD